MIKTIKRMFATKRLVKEAEQVGDAIVKNPNDTCSYYLSSKNYFSKDGNLEDKNVVDIYSKVKEAVEQKLDKSNLQNLNVLVYPKFDFSKKYIGFEIKLRF